MQSDNECLEASSGDGAESTSDSEASESASTTGTITQDETAEPSLSVSTVYAQPVITQALPGDPKQSVRDGASEHTMAQLAEELFLTSQTRPISPGQEMANGEESQKSTFPAQILHLGNAEVLCTRSQTVAASAADKLGQLIANLAQLPVESPAEPLEFAAGEASSNEAVQIGRPAQHAVSADQPCPDDSSINAASRSDANYHQSSTPQVLHIFKQRHDIQRDAVSLCAFGAHNAGCLATENTLNHSKHLKHHCKYHRYALAAGVW